MQLFIAPDTQQNIVYAVYFILLHNFAAILYSAGIFIMALWSLYKPKRWKLCIMWGFIILLFAFEYNKHIVDSLVEQTRNSLITERQSWRLERYVHIVLARLVPLALPLFGWMLVVLGAWMRVASWEEKIDDFLKKK